MKKVEHEAAARTLNGNGRSPDLPPLPTTGMRDEDTNSSNGLGVTLNHPYGALPHGNSLAHSDPSTTTPDYVRTSGLGNLRPLNDEQVLMILSFLSGNDLAKWVQCSRFGYVAGHHDELWRDLTLRSADVEKRSIDFYQKWRDTYVLQACTCRMIEQSRQESPCRPDIGEDEKSSKEDEVDAKAESISVPHSFRPHRPINVAGVYSDTFYRSWLCRSFEIEPSWLSIETIERVDAKAMTADRFVSEYELTNNPVIVKDATVSWPAIQKWNRQYLIDKTRGVTFRATSGAAPLPSSFTMESYARYCDGAAEEAPIYLFDRTFSQTAPHLLDDFVPALKKTCPYLDPSAPHGHDLFSLLGERRRPDYRWVIVGPKRSGSAFHIDPNCTHAWNAPIVGRKRWIFYPPGVNPPGVYPSANGDDVTMPISIGEWFLTYWDEHCRRRDSLSTLPSERPLECTVSPGEILFVPHGWWHTVLNLDDGLSIALTQNYVSSSNVGDVLRFLDTRITQISGCRDRFEAIRPEELSEEFRKILKEKRPDLLKAGEAAASSGWSCRAWSDCIQDQADGRKRRREHWALGPSACSILDRAKDASLDATSSQEGKRESGFSFSFL